MIERVQAVFAANRKKASRRQPPIHHLGHRFAHPVDIWLRGTVFKRQHKDQMPMRGCLGGVRAVCRRCCLLGLRVQGDPDSEGHDQQSIDRRAFHANRL